MGVTIKDIASLSGVSVATVSHIINKTRYVSPELVQKVTAIMEETGYSQKISEKENRMAVGKASVIAFVVPNISATIYSRIAAELNAVLVKNGYLIAVYTSNDDIKLEKHILRGLITNKRIGGIILAPVSNNSADYDNLFRSKIPFVCLDRVFKDNSAISITSKNSQALYTGTSHLIKYGHNSIVLLMDKNTFTPMSERLDGYKSALIDNNIPIDEELIVQIDSYGNSSNFENRLYQLYDKKKPTAIIACGNQLTLLLVKSLQNIGIDYPNQISVVGFGDEQWCELVQPPLTTLKQDSEQLAQNAANKLIELIEGKDFVPQRITVPVKLTIRKSTQMIGRGPFGEKAFSPSDIELTDSEKRRLREGKFKVGISFHYGGTAWTHLHETAIRNTLENYGVAVISVMDANFDPELQITQLDAISMQKPDLIIAIPADDSATADKFKEIAKKTKLIFISNVPEGLQTNEYASCVSVNERENGSNAAQLMGEYYRGRQNVKAGIIRHGAPFYGTHLRDMVAEQTIREQFENIDIVSIGSFDTIRSAYDVCVDMLTTHSEIQTLYVSWDQPALAVIKALKDLDREDVTIFTFDLDVDIAQYLASGIMVKGLSTQQPYKQGEAVALAAAKALVGGQTYKYIGVAPYIVKPQQLIRAWKEILRKPVPKAIEAAISGNELSE